MLCRNCKSDVLNEVLNLGDHPWCNDFLDKENVGKENLYPLILVHCPKCDLLQLNYTVPKETMFKNHCYVSGTTKSLRTWFLELAKENKEQFNLTSKDLIVDIGGNDGTQLLQYKDIGLSNVINVESADNIAKLSVNSGVPVINDYFNEELVKSRIGEKKVKLINASGVFFHLEELHSVIRGIKYCLQDDGIFVVQCMYAGTMIEKLNFDTIYHEHLCYYTLKSLENLLTPYNLEAFDAYYSEIHSGSLIVKFTHSENKLQKTARYEATKLSDLKYDIDSFKEFASTIRGKRGKLKELLETLKKDGAKIYAYGAPAKGNTLLNYFDIDSTLVDKCVEVNDLKVGRVLPKSHIPIEKETSNDFPDYYLLLAHNFADEIIAKNKHLIAKGVKFIIPFPTPTIVGE